jgi:hypothetical protein
VEHRQAELEKVHRSIWPDAPSSGPAPSAGTPTNLDADEVVRRARQSRNGSKFERLWSGDLAGHKSRSEADLALCSYFAFWCGPNSEARIDELFRQSGLFRSKWNREDYRQRTIAKALAGRTEFYTPSRQGRTSRANINCDPKQSSRVPWSGLADGQIFANYRQRKVETTDGPVTVKVALPIKAVGRDLMCLARDKLWRVRDMLFTEDPEHEILWLGNPESLFAWIGRLLPHAHENCLHWAAGENKVSRGEFCAYLQQTVPDFDAVEKFPHEPPLPRHHYLHPEPRGKGKALQELLGRFNPLTLVDYDLMLAFFLTLLWGGAPGQRPAWLVTTDDEDDAKKGRGSGKTALARHGAHLVGGLVQASAKDEMSKLVTRLLTPKARELRIVLLDNIKSLKFSWAELEALITSDTISGHQLFTGEGRRPNTLIWCLTINGASLSRDMAQRTVVIKVKRPEYSATWEDETREFINAKRWDIIGDCLAILRGPTTPLARYSRWGAWEAGVLSRVGDPSECQRVIAERQEDIDDDDAESDMVREGFRAELTKRLHNPDFEAIWIPAAVAANIVNEATGERYPRNRAGVYLGTLGIPELRKSNQHARGWAWRGLQSDPQSPLSDLKPLPYKINPQECGNR